MQLQLVVALFKHFVKICFIFYLNAFKIIKVCAKQRRMLFNRIIKSVVSSRLGPGPSHWNASGDAVSDTGVTMNHARQPGRKQKKSNCNQNWERSQLIEFKNNLLFVLRIDKYVALAGCYGQREGGLAVERWAALWAILRPRRARARLARPLGWESRAPATPLARGCRRRSCRPRAAAKGRGRAAGPRPGCVLEGRCLSQDSPLSSPVWTVNFSLKGRGQKQ